MKPLRLLVVDDHEVVRRGIRNLLESSRRWKVCCEARSGTEALRMARRYPIDMVILDISMPGLDGIETTRRLRKQVPGAEVLIVSMHEDYKVIRQALEAGALGYVSKSDSANELLAAMEALRVHKPFFSSTMLELMVANCKSESSRSESHHQVTNRECQVIRHLAQGKSNKETAEALNISVKTVEAHRGNIMHKLGIHSLAELVHFAVREEMVQI